jgi:hypothetical protein
MRIITTEMLFENNVKQIIRKIEQEYQKDIQTDFDNEPSKYPDLLTWLELQPGVVGRAFMQHIIEYGITNEDIN